MDQNIFWVQNSFRNHKIFSPQTIYLPAKIFLDPTKFKTPKYFGPKKNFDPKKFLTQNIMGLKNVLTPKNFWSTKFVTLKLCNENILFDIFTPKNYGRKIFSAPEFLDTKKLLCLKIYTFKGDSPSISRLFH